MSKTLITYAFIKSIYDRNKDYLDTFSPLALIIIKRGNRPLDINKIQKNLTDYFKIRIPIHTLKSILARAKRKGYLITEERKNSLTDKGIKFLDNLESERDVERRINALKKDLKKYINDSSLDDEKILEILLQFINKNIETLIFFCVDSRSLDSLYDVPKRTSYENIMISYFYDTEKENPQIWRTIQDIVYGSIISLSPNTIDITEEKKKIRELRVFIDSNFLFSLLKLDIEEISKPILELFNLMKEYKFRIKIFDFTIDEVIRVLKGYIKNKNKYIEGVRVSSIYSTLKNKNWSSQDVLIFIQNLYKSMQQLGIAYYNTSINLKDFSPGQKLIEDLNEYKEYSEYSFLHDLAAIKMIAKIRGGDEWKIENAKTIFLTSDLRLSKFNFEKMGHKEKNTICEVIPDKLLTNILWLKDQNKFANLPLSMVISANSKDLLINNRIWSRFIYNLEELKKSNQINDLDISMLFYDNHIINVLSDFNESDIKRIDSDFILEESLKSKQKIDEETKKKLEADKEIYNEKITEKDREIEKYINKFKKIRKGLEDKASNKANIFTNIIFIATFFLIVIVSTILPLLLKENILFLAFLLAVLPILGLKINLFKIKSKLKEKLFNKYLENYIVELNLVDK